MPALECENLLGSKFFLGELPYDPAIFEARLRVTITAYEYDRIGAVNKMLRDRPLNLR